MNKEVIKTATNTDRDEGSSVVVEERKRLKELRERIAEKESCIIFYCKECRGLVDVTKNPRKYSFTCNLCKGRQIAFGTDVSIRKFFHLKDDDEPLTEVDFKKRMEEEAKISKERAERKESREKEVTK
ncbi:MAG: hypothetical protein Q8P68_03055 [Candidatus Peregrinibacteria bacterium]|nr:hypothetical protein [Candidatus Peregrinibacteria bacterium]MDZ4244712.1 hypothetical protein [Candidatus Gracilibacteria bacterium]